MKGLDFGWGKLNNPQHVVDLGYQFVCRYLSLNQEKNLTRLELQQLRSVGLKVCVVWETTTRRCMQGFDAGVEDANRAEFQLNNILGNNSKPIYFACDDDFQDDEMSVIAQYFKGVISVLGVDQVGVYGGLRIVKYLFDNSLCTYGWQTLAWSKRNGVHVWDERAQLRQVNTDTNMIGGVDCDIDESVQDDFGQF